MKQGNYKSIIFDVANGVGKITFNLPQYGNALTLEGVQETLDALNRCEASDEVGAVMLTGAGRSFCAGFNLKEIPPADADIEDIAAHFQLLAMWWHQLLHKIIRIKRPVLVAVNGVAACPCAPIWLSAMTPRASYVPGTPSAWPTTPPQATHSPRSSAFAAPWS